jgi:hypothetical protein
MKFVKIRSSCSHQTDHKTEQTTLSCIDAYTELIDHQRSRLCTGRSREPVTPAMPPQKAP